MPPKTRRFTNSGLQALRLFQKRAVDDNDEAMIRGSQIMSFLSSRLASGWSSSHVVDRLFTLRPELRCRQAYAIVRFLTVYTPRGEECRDEWNSRFPKCVSLDERGIKVPFLVATSDEIVVTPAPLSEIKTFWEEVPPTRIFAKEFMPGPTNWAVNSN